MKKLLSILLSACLFISVIAVSVSADFTDVPEGSWAEESVTFWTENGVVESKSDTEFGANDFMTRAEVADMINNLLQLKDVDLAILDRYSDVDATSPYAQAIANCTAVGIFTGHTDGTFRPNDPVIREQIIAVLGRALKLRTPEDAEKDFTDAASISSYAEPFINAFVNDGRLDGYPDGSIQPLKPVSKAEACKLLSNAVDVYVTEPGTYEVEEGSIVLVVTDGEVVIEGEPDKVAVYDEDAVITVEEGTDILNESGDTVSVNGKQVPEGESEAPAESGEQPGTTTTTYKLTFTVSGPTKYGEDATETQTVNYLTAADNLTNVLLTKVLWNTATLDATFNGTGFDTLIISGARNAYAAGTLAEFATEYQTTGDAFLKDAFINDSAISVLDLGTTYTMSFTAEARYNTTVGGTYTITVLREINR